jgi:hypothetical protein
LKTLDNHLSKMKTMVETLLKSNYFSGFYCHGSYGIGKTTLISDVLAENNASFVTLSTYSTPLYFYNCLYKNKDKVVLLDDCKGVFENRSAGFPLIKDALRPYKNSSKRILRWGTSTHLAATNEFEFDGKLIIISDTLPFLDTDKKAFKNRCLSYNIWLNKEQRLEMLADAVESKAEQVAYNFLKETADKISVEGINYAALAMGASLFEVERRHWKKLLLRTLPEDKEFPLQIVRQLAESDLLIEKQFCKFRALTLLGRRSFFKYRKECGLRKNVWKS